MLAGLASARAEQQLCGMLQRACEVALGEYMIEVPDKPGHGEKLPAIIYFHGAGGSGERSMKNRDMVETFLAAGYAVIAPSGQVRPGRTSRFGRLWSFHPKRPKIRDELTFTRQVLSDAAIRFGIDRDRVLMTGFSIGGSLTWYLACQDPGIAKAYAPVAGAFWRPHPASADCKGPVKLLHTHGWRDTTVPLEGRLLRSGDLIQGDVFHGLEIMREVNGCDQLRADGFETTGLFMKRWWTRCSPGSALQFNLFDGAHSVPEGWAREAIAWFEGLKYQDKASILDN